MWISSDRWLLDSVSKLFFFLKKISQFSTLNTFSNLTTLCAKFSYSWPKSAICSLNLPRPPHTPSILLSGNREQLVSNLMWIALCIFKGDLLSLPPSLYLCPPSEFISSCHLNHLLPSCPAPCPSLRYIRRHFGPPPRLCVCSSAFW